MVCCFVNDDLSSSVVDKLAEVGVKYTLNPNPPASKNAFPIFLQLEIASEHALQQRSMQCTPLFAPRVNQH